MTPEFYTDQFRRYATYVREFGGNHIQRIACGPNGFDYKWTEVLMQKAGGQMGGLALHYYCGTGRKSRSATQYAEEDWFHLLHSALRMEELITKHSAIMDRSGTRWWRRFRWMSSTATPTACAWRTSPRSSTSSRP
jgi:alpha-N-arabinofuranosidase